MAKDWEVREYFLGDGKATSVLELAKGKDVKFAPARKEAYEAVPLNTSSNWIPKISVFNYLHEKD